MRSKEEGRRLVEAFAQSGMTRKEFCEKHNVAITTLDYWRHNQGDKPRFAEVAIDGGSASPGFTLVLVNGRRIESSWQFSEGDLVRLIHAAEA